MPKISKLTKESRNRKVIAGIRANASHFDEHGIGPDHLRSGALVAILEKHIALLDEIDRYERLKSDAIAREAQLEKEILELHALIRQFVRGVFGASSAKVREFGMKPRRAPRMKVVDKAIAVAKRNATRAARGTKGKRQRLKIKGW